MPLQMMLFYYLFQNPQYRNFRSKVKIYSPWMNNTQNFQVAYNAISQQIKYAAENASDQICDLSIGSSSLFLYGRTTKNVYQCLYYNQPWSETYVEFIPVLENFTLVAVEILYGISTNHYRYIQYNTSQQQSGEPQYTDETIYQQDFWCSMDNQTGNCLPLKYKTSFFFTEIKQNNKDVIIIEYQNFEFLTDTRDFEFNFYGITEQDCFNSKHRKQFIILDIIKGIQNNHWISQMKAIYQGNNNANYTFKQMPNQFMGQNKLKIARNLANFNNSLLLYLNDPLAEDIPTNFDWRTRGVINPVKDQQFCGSCWIFSTTGVLEAAMNIARWKINDLGPNIVLAEQETLDCFWDFSKRAVAWGMGGCEAGDNMTPQLTVDLLSSWVGRSVFASEHAYPYLGQDDWCKSVSDVRSLTVTAVHQVPPNNIIQMKRAIMRGPVSVNTATPNSFMFYQSGIFNDPACEAESIDHVVIIVGWGESEQGPYWVVRNSWGPAWGVDGYIYVSMKSDLCGLLSHAAWVEVEQV